jgi:HlyD family secretion protein
VVEQSASSRRAIDRFNSDRGFGLKSRFIVGSLAAGLLVLGLGGWAVTAELSGAVIAQGSIVVLKHVKKVQHLDGGIVAKLNVQNGAVVNAGDILVRLDNTQLLTELGIIRSQLIELTGRSMRLTAERDGLETIAFPSDFDAMGPEAPKVMTGELRLFAAGRITRNSKKQQLELRIEQSEEEIKGLTSQMKAKAGEMDLIKRELVQIEELHRRKLTPVSRVYAMQREYTRIDGDHGGLVARIARAKGQISEVRIQILSLGQTLRSDTQRELRDIEARIAELRERAVAARDRLARTELRAPVSGVIHELAVHTVGGVITPAEPVMVIVPKNDDLTVEARLSPNDIDQVSIGQEARLRFSAFNQRTTPEMHGQVTRISADVTLDTTTGQSYYVGRVEIYEKSFDALGSRKLIPGMPVEVFISTGERTALSYLAKPFTDQMARAFREE